MPTRVVLETLSDEGVQTQVITFRCLGGSLQGSLKFSRGSGRFTFKVVGVSVWRGGWGEGEVYPAGREKPRKPLAFLRDIGLFQAFLKAVRRLFQDILEAVSFERFFCRLRIGLGDPASTGVVFGMSYPMIELVRSSFSKDEVDLELEPDWMGFGFEVSARGTLSFRLASLVIPLIRFFRDGSVRRFLSLIK